MKPLCQTKLLTLSPYEVILWGESKDRPLWRGIVQAFSEDEAKEQALHSWRYSAAVQLHGANGNPSVEVLFGSHLCNEPQKRQRSLFEELAEFVLGHSMADIESAAVNLLLTSVQRRAGNLAEAERCWDELMGRGKVALQRRYRKEQVIGGPRDTALETEIVGRLGAQ